MVRLKLSAQVVVAVLACGLAAAAQTLPGTALAPGSAETPPPQVREMLVTGQAVHVRSGPGLYYYVVAQLDEPTRVEVLGEENGWQAVRPPASVVALVRKSDVARGEGDNAVVDKPAARVYARDPGSDRTWAVIARLAKDGPVTVTGEYKEFHTIAMPAAARVYVSAKYLKPIPTMDNGTTPPVAPGPLPDVKPLKLDPQTEAYGKAVALLDAELEKPLVERDYSAAETALKDVLDKAETDYLKADAEIDLATVKLHRELQEGLKRLEADRETFRQEMEAVRKKETDRLGDESKLPTDTMTAGNFEGVLMPMRTRMAYRWRLQDDQVPPRFVCLLSGDDAILEAYVGKRVRVWGDRILRVDLKVPVCDVRRIEEAAGESGPPAE